MPYRRLCLGVHSSAAGPEHEGGTPARMLRRATRLQHAITEQTEATERALADHFRSHQVTDWLDCIERLRQKIADRDARIAELERSTT